MKHYGDITKLSGWDLPVVDCITGGSPCQDLSVAGPRAGLNGKRSGLFMEQIRIPEKLMPPTRLVRYCCEKLKESGGDGRVTVTGVRWAESTNRKNNQGPVVIQGDFKENEIEGQHGLFDDDDDAFDINDRHGSLILTNDNEENRRTMEFCYKRHKTTVNPIIEWTDEDVWEFIRAEGIPYCKLYNEGFSRLGCIGCPMAGTHERLAEFARRPKYKAAYLRAFTAMLKERERRGKLDGTWRMGTTAEDVYRWWMEFEKYGIKPDL